jgi:hypothetical protein
VIAIHQQDAAPMILGIRQKAFWNFDVCSVLNPWFNLIEILMGKQIKSQWNFGVLFSSARF